jgi:hypothetical protein
VHEEVVIIVVDGLLQGGHAAPFFHGNARLLFDAVD